VRGGKTEGWVITSDIGCSTAFAGAAASPEGAAEPVHKMPATVSGARGCAEGYSTISGNLKGTVISRPGVVRSRCHQEMLQGSHGKVAMLPPVKSGVMPGSCTVQCVRGLALSSLALALSAFAPLDLFSNLYWSMIPLVPSVVKNAFSKCQQQFGTCRGLLPISNRYP
jgi:hypothetical protein